MHIELSERIKTKGINDPETWHGAFNPVYKVLSPEQSKLLFSLLLAEREIADSEQTDDYNFLSEIVRLRIEGMNLPIKFTRAALHAVNCFAWNPGSAVVLLIDALNLYEGQEVNVEKLIELYPWGFYTEESFGDYVDNYMKPRKIKWSEVYVSQ